MQLDGSIATFEVSIKDELTFETYIGQFKVKCFKTPLDTIKADRFYRELIGSVSPTMASVTAQNMAFAISELSVRTLEAPNWFNLKSDIPGGQLSEPVLTEILSKAIEAEEEYRKQQREKFEAIQKRLQMKFESGIVKKQALEEEEEPTTEDGEPEEIDIESE